MRTHRDLTVYKDSMTLVTDIYNITRLFPTAEMYGLTNQIRRSAISIPSNISEGAARKSKKEYMRFLYISLGSNSELETQIIISKNLNYIKEDDYESIMSKINSIGKMLNALIMSIQKHITKPTNQPTNQPTTN